MKLARLHRRLASAMALAALGAYAAGDGVGPMTLAAAIALALSVLWLPDSRAGAWIERATRVGILALFGWLVYGALLLGHDFLPGVMAMLLFLLAGEALRPLEARNDMRLYSLSFALLIASTAFYPGIGFAFGFASYVGLTVLAMMVGYLRRETERFRGGGTVRVGRAFLWTTVALSGMTLAMSAGVFLLFPRLPRAWNVQGRRGAGGEVAGFSDRVSIGDFGGRIGSNPEVMFRVEFPDGPPPGVEGIHWRGRSFDRFDGEEWMRTALAAFARDLDARGYAIRWGGPFRRMRIFGGPPGADVLFGPHPVLNVQPRSAIQVFTGATGDIGFAGTDNPVYTVTSAGRRPSDDALRAEAGADAGEMRAYLQLPPLDPRVRRLADSLTAGRATRIDQVRAVEAWLRTFRYTLDLPSGREDASIEGFLFRRREGHCEYFSTAMAVLLRARGIPTRNVNGFLGGEWNTGAGYLAVTGNQAHSWVEVWFPGWGWVPFDPTPASRGDVVADAGRGWAWSTRLWMDGIEYRWYKWVVDYNMERQLSVFRGIGSVFSRGDQGGIGRRDQRAPVRVAAPWLLVPLGLALLWLLASRRRPGGRLHRESRAYLSLRKAYARAGWAPVDGGPLEFAQSLAVDRAPGADDAAAAVDLYLRARFSGRPADPPTVRELDERAARARAAVRRAGKRRKPAGV
ncbi:MAG TPA: transglutaminaseTgpA domain-containing protein [Longimicrobium sp.]|nr:transglutaminaseTgpA domain-containing protein [Longimicrobium sp.]